jgi:RNA polymerase sigma-B factor
MPSGALTALAEGLTSSDVEVLLDVHPAGWPRRQASSSDFKTAVNACAAELRESWAQQRPDLVHAVGYVAAVAAVRESGGEVPVVVTGYQPEPWEGLERWLAKRVDSWVVHSSAEQDRLRRLGVPREKVRVLPLAVQPGPDQSRRREPFGVVVTDATGAELDALVASMPTWRGRLVVLEQPSAARLDAVVRRAAQLGVVDRLEWRADLSADQSVELVAHSDLVVAVSSSRSGALVSLAAAWGVAAVAVDRDAHCDLLISRATGLLLPARPGARDIGEAVRMMLGDAMMSRGYGAAAQVRARAVQSPAALGPRVAAAYTAVLTPQLVPQPAAPVDQQRRQDRDQLVAEYLPLARQLAQRYAGRGQALDDLVQVAGLGLVKAAERFDPEHGSGFPSYAIPTILGELRRHFRDHAWAVRVPRTLQETTLQVEKASERLSQKHGEATVEQVAEELGLSDWEVQKARQTSGEAFARTSLDHPVGEDGGGSLGDLVGEEDSSLESVEDRLAVRRALRHLPEREREIVLLRFFGERTQVEIAQELGISQVHVSRTLTRTLAALRDHIVDEVPLPESWTAARR